MWALAPCDLFLFPKLKEVIKGTRFQDSEAIKTAIPGGTLPKVPGRGDWNTACEHKEITLKAICCKIYLSIKNKTFKDPVLLLFKHTSYVLKV